MQCKSVSLACNDVTCVFETLHIGERCFLSIFPFDECVIVMALAVGCFLYQRVQSSKSTCSYVSVLRMYQTGRPKSTHARWIGACSLYANLEGCLVISWFRVN